MSDASAAASGAPSASGASTDAGDDGDEASATDGAAGSGRSGTEDSIAPGRRSERVAVVAAVLGVLALVAEAGHGGVVLAGVGGVATAGALGRLDASSSAAWRGLAALGLLAGAAGVAATFGSPFWGWWPLPPLTLLAATCWTATVATVVGGDLDRVGRRLRTVGGTTAVAAAGVGVAAVLAAGRGGAASVASATARSLWGALAGVVAGPAAGFSLPFLGGMVAALATSLLLALGAIPGHVLLSPRADREAVSGLATVKWVLARLGVGAGLFALVTYSLGLPSVPLGPLWPVGTLVRALLLLGVLLGALGIVVGLFLTYVWDPSGDPLDAIVPTVGGGLLAAVAATAGTAGAGSWTGTGLLAGLAGLAVAGLVGATAIGLGALAIDDTLLETGTGPVVPAAALVLGAVAVAGRPDALLAPVLAVAAGLVVWDALRLRDDLGHEVPGADTAGVERRHVGGTVAVATLGVTAAVAIRFGGALAGPVLGGEPLVVVVAGTVVLVGVVALFARNDRI